MPPESGRKPVRRWKRRHVVLLVLVVLAVAMRAALPEVLRRVAVDQANQYVLGEVRIGDVDLGLLQGSLALEDVGLRTEGTEEGAPETVAWRRIAVNVGWLSLLRRTIRVQDFELAGLAVHLHRLADGALRLPQLREMPEEPEPEPEEPGEPWAVVVEHAALRDGSVRFEDRVTDPPIERDFALPTLEVSDLRLQPAPDAGPGRAALSLGIRDGGALVAARVRAVPGGYAIRTRVRLTSIPLDRLHVHLPRLRWSGSAGRLDGNLDFHMAPDRGPVAAGRIALREVEVKVPDEEAAALAFGRFEVVVDGIDLGRSDARIARVGLNDARVLVHAREPVPLPLLAGIMGAPAEAGAGPEPTADAAPAEEPAAEKATPAADVPSGADAETEAPPEVEPAADAAPWTWQVAEVDVRDVHATVLLEPPPLEIDVVRANVTGLSSEPGSQAEVALELREGEGRIGVNGTLGLDPVTTDVAVELAGLDVGRLTAASGAVPLQLAGTLAGDLGLALDPEAIVVKGTLGLATFEALLPEGEGLRVAWEDLSIDAQQVRLAQPPGGAVDVKLAAVSLQKPAIEVTRTADGFVLPASGGAEADAGAVPAAAVEDAEAGDEPPPDGEPGAFTARVEQVKVEGGSITFDDMSVSPAFEGNVTRLDLDVHGVTVPGGVPDRVDLSCRVEGAPLTVTGVRRGQTTQVTVNAKELPLRPFNPYASASGYTVAGGTLSVESEANWGAAAYDAETDLAIDQLAMAGAEGESLFQKRFGLPLSVAIALLKDMSGRIALTVPVEGGQDGTRIDIGAIVAQALARAIAGALVSPLKLLGAVKLSGDRIEAFDPRPTPFAPGTTVPTTEGREQAAVLGRTLGQLPRVRLAIRGMAGPADVRGLKEMAVLAMLEEEDEGFIGGVRNVLSFGKRNDVREALAARARGEEGALDEDDREQLDEWVAERTVSDADLRALADARAESIRAELVDEQGADPAQVSVEPSAIETQRGAAYVTVEIVAREGDARS